MPKLELDLPYTEEGEALASLLEQQIPGVRRVAPANQPGMLADRARRSYPTPPPVPAGAQPQDWRTNPRGVPSDPRGAWHLQGTRAWEYQRQNLPSVVGPDGQRQPRGGRIPGVTLPGGVQRRQLGGGFNVHPTTGPTGEPLTPARRPPRVHDLRPRPHFRSGTSAVPDSELNRVMNQILRTLTGSQIGEDESSRIPELLPQRR